MATPNYVLLERFELASAASSITFSNIPQSGYTDLKMVVSARTTNGGVAYDTILRFNGNSTGYSERMLRGDGTAAASFSQSGSNIAWTYANASSSTAATNSNVEIFIPNYLSGNNKSISIDGVVENNAAEAYQFMVAGLWSNVSAINSIYYATNGGTWAANSTFSLYGLAAVGTTPAIYPKALGGNVIVNDGTYWYHAFTSTGIFTPQTGLTCNYLVVAGGGGGGTNPGGGGGAGGLRSSVTATGGGGSLESAIDVLANTNYAISIGAGGTAPGNSAPGSKGGNSTFSTITSAGGGTGRNNNGTTQNGGSGGGANYFATTPGTGTANQGYGGGTASGSSGTLNAGGGGGAGAAGGNAASGGNSAAGGAGVQITAFATPTGTGANSGYYAGGGGGGPSVQGASAGAGGAGGGATGGANNGIAGTGGGGGGASGADGIGGAGGSGIVIIRYAMA